MNLTLKEAVEISKGFISRVHNVDETSNYYLLAKALSVLSEEEAEIGFTDWIKANLEPKSQP